MLPVAVPQGEGEHARQARHAVGAPAFPGVDDGFRVAAVAEDVAEGGQFVAQRLEIVDLAVEDDGDAVVLVIHRLLAAGGVDDGQAAVAQGYAGLQVKAFAIRPAMGDGVGHGFYGRVRGGGGRVLVQDPGYAAHRLNLGLDGL